MSSKIEPGKVYVQVILEPTGKGRDYDEHHFEVTSEGSRVITREQFHGLAEHQGAEALQPAYVEKGWFADWLKEHPSGRYQRALKK